MVSYYCKEFRSKKLVSSLGIPMATVARGMGMEPKNVYNYFMRQVLPYWMYLAILDLFGRDASGALKAGVPIYTARDGKGRGHSGVVPPRFRVYEGLTTIPSQPLLPPIDPASILTGVALRSVSAAKKKGGRPLGSKNKSKGARVAWNKGKTYHHKKKRGVDVSGAALPADVSGTAPNVALRQAADTVALARQSRYQLVDRTTNKGADVSDEMVQRLMGGMSKKHKPDQPNGAASAEAFGFAFQMPGQPMVRISVGGVLPS